MTIFVELVGNPFYSVGASLQAKESALSCKGCDMQADGKRPEGFTGWSKYCAVASYRYDLPKDAVGRHGLLK